MFNSFLLSVDTCRSTGRVARVLPGGLDRGRPAAVVERRGRHQRGRAGLVYELQRRERRATRAARALQTLALGYR